MGTSVCCLRRAILVAALGIATFAQEPPGTACTEETQGTLWPAEANADRTVARHLIQAGELYMCTLRARGHRWELLGVNIKALESAGSRKKAAPASDATASGAALRARLYRH